MSERYKRYSFSWWMLGAVLLAALASPSPSLAQPSTGSVLSPSLTVGRSTCGAMPDPAARIYGLWIATDAATTSACGAGGGANYVLYMDTGNSWVARVAGNSDVACADVTDSTAAGCALLTALTAALQRTALGLGTSATLNTAASGNASSAEVVKGNDTRLSDSRTPSSTLAHASTHESGGTDALSGTLAVDISGNAATATSATSAGSATTATTATTASGLVCSGCVDASDLSATPVPVANGGTGLSSLTAHAILFGNGTDAPALLTPGTSGYVLTSNGAAADPSWQAPAVTVPGSTTQVIFNDAGALGADAGVVYDKTADALTVSGSVATATLSTPSSGVNLTIDPAGSGHVVVGISDLFIGTDSCSGNCPTGARFDLRTNGSTADLRVKAGNDTTGLHITAGGFNVFKAGAVGADSNLIATFENSGDNARLAFGSGGKVCWTSTSENVNPGACDIHIRRARKGTMSLDADGFAALGDARTSNSVLRRQTVDATPTELLLDGTTTRMVLDNDTTWSFQCQVVARRTDADGESAGYLVSGVIDRQTNAASTALVGAAATVPLAEDNIGWDVAATADTTNGALILTVTGEGSKTIRWVAGCRITETSG